MWKVQGHLPTLKVTSCVYQRNIYGTSVNSKVTDTFAPHRSMHNAACKALATRSVHCMRPLPARGDDMP